MSFESIPDAEKLIQYQKLKAVTFWDSRFNFLSVHNGLRPSRVHWLLGTTGSGKSTLMKSIIADSAKEHPVLILLTEEDVKRYGPGIIEASPQINRENLKFMTEREIPGSCRKDLKKMLTWLEDRVVTSGCRIFFWDNLTTSAIFGQSFGNAGQEEAVYKIRDLCDRLEVTFFIAIHTAKNVTDNMGKMIMGEDVRGTQTTFMSADYFYILQRFEVGSQFYPFIRIAKARDYDLKEKNYLLHYANGVYVKDGATTFEKINETFVQRNVLGQKKKAESGPRSPYKNPNLYQKHPKDGF